jgi:hypothetical protein
LVLWGHKKITRQFEGIPKNIALAGIVEASIEDLLLLLQQHFLPIRSNSSDARF